MKKLTAVIVLLAGFLAVPTASEAAIAFVQSTGEINTGADSAPVTTPAITTTSGNAIFITANCHSAAGAPTMSISDNKSGNTWTEVLTQSNGNSRYTRQAFDLSINGGAGHTFTITPTAPVKFCSIAVAEFSGIDAAAGLDDSAGGANPGTTTHNSPDIANSQADALIIGSLVEDTAGALATISVAGSFASLYINNGTLSQALAIGMEYRIVAATSTTYHAEFSTTATETTGVIGAIYLATGGGGGGPSCPQTLSLMGVGC